MSRGTPDTGDNNPFASARILRTLLLMVVFLMVFYVVGQLLHAIPRVNSGLATLLARVYRTGLNDQPNGGGGGGGGGAGGGGGSGKVAGKGIGKAQAQIRQAFVGNRGLATAAQAQEVVTSIIRMQQTIESLPEAERAEARAERDKLAGELFKARMKEYLTASPAKRRAELDRQIGQDELMRRAWRVARKQSGGAAAGEGFPGGGGGWPGEEGAGGSEDDRNRHLKNFLDSTSPEQRARYEEYRRAMEARRQQRGLGS